MPTLNPFSDLTLRLTVTVNGVAIPMSGSWTLTLATAQYAPPVIVRSSADGVTYTPDSAEVEATIHRFFLPPGEVAASLSFRVPDPTHPHGHRHTCVSVPATGLTVGDTPGCNPTPIPLVIPLDGQTPDNPPETSLATLDDVTTAIDNIFT
ncbi:MAG: hypothetical protein NC342_09195 [Pseudoflavonifractor sp.]|nr:hypothetical protein [Alloprevotella sp.]MCM1117695.1 hypothetical protein [Pseudoflavonifractor sp.]